MSGIAGILSLDGTPPTQTAINLMTKGLERRGPDGTHSRIDGHVALGHTLLATTPEALVEVLPLFDEPSGCTITADARIDNREELMAQFGLANATRVIGDGELILRAYLKWGDECAAHLLGDFAFAIWDPRAERLLCARDQIGLRQLIYHHDPARHFVFATEPRAILAHPGVSRRLNPDRINDYYGNMEGADLNSTFFQDLFRLPPAHILTVDQSGLTMRRYWQPAPEPALDLPSDEAYAEAFLKVFTRSVECRLRSAGPVGAMLSGGIDSNAVAAVAAKLLSNAGRGPLPTFSAIDPETTDCAETRAIRAAVGSPLFAPTTICPAATDQLAELVSMTRQSDEPFDGHMGIIRAVYLAAQHAGVRIILDGVGGDIVLASHFHLASLLREGRVGQAFREARGGQRFWGEDAPAWRSLFAATWQAFAPTPLRAARFWHGRRKANRRFLEGARARSTSLEAASAQARRLHVQERDFEHDRVDGYTRIRPLTHPNLVVGRERYDRVAAACGIEARDPFLDLRLIRFCLSLPRDQLQRDGWPKWILRRALAGAVPAEVAWRAGKEHVGPQFTRAILDRIAPFPGATAVRPDLTALNLRYENVFILTWFAYMDQLGRATGQGDGGEQDHGA